MTTQPEVRAWAVSAEIWDLTWIRWRIVCEMLSRMPARLPPTVEWIVIAVTIRSRSSEPTRRTILVRACSVEVAMFISRIARDSSSEIGGAVVRETLSSP